MPAPGGSEVDPGTASRPGAAGALLGALSAGIVFAVLLSIKGIPGRSNGGDYVEFAAAMAAVPCVVAAFMAVQLARGRARTAPAVGWFIAACMALLFLIFVAAVSNSGLGS